MESPSLAPCLAAVRHVALDMDGTIFCGSEVFPESGPFLATLTRLGIGYSFLTNNSSKDRDEYVRHLERFGLTVSREEIFISTQAAIGVLREEYPEVARLYTAGSEGMRRELREAGFEVLQADAAERPDAVLVGFDLNPDYRTLCKAAYWVRAGLPYLATHPDWVCPTDQETVLLDCGSVCAAIAAATGRKPDAVAGKPAPRMLHALCARLGWQPHQIAMVGDRLYTDIRMALDAGALAVLTLTGETKRPQLAASPVVPDLVVENLAELGARLTAR